jgi:pimeloyl-ACP methyl ester carboxylesterase
MANVRIAGIDTRYEVVGSGPPLLMYAPGGFDATIEKWSTLNVYARIKLLEHLPGKYSCIVFDRRECGQSGGRVEPVAWPHFVEQGKGLLDHLGIKAAHIAGGCMGCSCAIAFAALHPDVVLSLLLWWPVGGAKYRIKGHQRFFDHLAFVDQQGLGGVVELVKREGKAFNAEPRGGPWASVIKRDAQFASQYASQDVDEYKTIVTDMACALLDRDTAPGAEPEQMLGMDIPALIIPGATNRTRPRLRAIWKSACRSPSTGTRPPRSRPRTPPRDAFSNSSMRFRKRRVVEERADRKESPHDHRHPRPLHDGAAAAPHLPRQAARGARRCDAQARNRGPWHQRRGAREERAAAAQAAEGSRERPHDLLAARGGMAHHVGTEETGMVWSRMSNDLIHRICKLLPTTSWVSASCHSTRESRSRTASRARAHRERAGLRRREPQSRSIGRATGAARRSPIATGIRSTRSWSSSRCRR